MGLSDSSRENPAITDGLIRLARGPLPGTSPVVHIVNGVTIGMYRSVRLTFKRALVEKLPHDGVILVIVTPREGDALALAITRRDFEHYFSAVLRSRAWVSRGSHDFSHLPRIAHRFLISY